MPLKSKIFYCTSPLIMNLICDFGDFLFKMTARQTSSGPMVCRKTRVEMFTTEMLHVLQEGIGCVYKKKLCLCAEANASVYVWICVNVCQCLPTFYMWFGSESSTSCAELCY